MAALGPLGRVPPQRLLVQLRCSPPVTLAGPSRADPPVERAAAVPPWPPRSPQAHPVQGLAPSSSLPGRTSRGAGAACGERPVSSAPGAGAALGARAWPAFYFSYCLQVVTQLNHSANQDPITTHREERSKLGCSQEAPGRSISATWPGSNREDWRAALKTRSSWGRACPGRGPRAAPSWSAWHGW